MRIGFISQWYEPETGSAAHPTAIARALRDRGHDLRVLTSFPSYPKGQVHSGYRMKLRLRETRDGIDVLRVPDVPSHDQSATRRAASLASFAASATANVGWLRHADVVLTYLTPATVGLVPWTLERMAGVPYVLYVQDLWPETVAASGFIGNERIANAVEDGISALLRRLYAKSSGVLALSPTMAATLAGRGAGVVPVSIPNWVDEAVFAPAEAGWRPQLPVDRKWMMYAGGMGDVQALDHAVRALARITERNDIGLAFVGDGVSRPSLERLTTELSLEDRVLFLGSRPMADMPALMAEAAAQLVSLRDLPLFRGTIPSKVQAAMACGAPIICAVAGDAADLVRRTESGVVVEPESSSGLADAFRKIADMSTESCRSMGAAGRRAYVSEMSAAAGAATLEQVLRAAAARRKK